MDLQAIKITERVNSCISLLGISFILFTYIFYPAFKKPINRLIFFATWGNLGLVLASLISVDGYSSSTTGSLCKFQGFVVQMFLGVDVWWALCMAINVYLAFFRGWTVSQLQALEVRYLLACYGLSFIPAFVFVFINKSNSSADLYGSATIWCWISEDYDWLRLVVVYAFIWAALLFSLVVYFFAGRVIWRKRAQLDGFLNPWNESPFSGTITTEIEITTESRHGFNDLVAENPASEATSDNSHRQYMINIESATNRKRGIPGINVRTITRDVASHETNAESWLYARAAFLFFITLAITWIPASAFRIYSVANNKAENFGLSYVASFLFPLQGFWNAVVYIITSRTACKEFWNSIRGRNKGSSVGEIVVGKPGQLGKRGKSGSFQTDEEELRPTKVMIYNKEDVRTESTTRLHAQSSHDDSVLALPSSHDVTTRSSVVEAGDTMGLSGYKR
ncbi:MAG: hypothetical protein GOMPHAMPRED_005902 [Gomphillus americanus]|uniref:G-protein coupled receptors family 2 profile 2 domain-containing protein n=1 Tax=Gomphillus americanus TaxID=1940652 RepID=A0A8H3G1F0_9LECA|nr:MAG: hypothetical protein GOMPHAMPRED_005902 [Gomphillus americanus]